MDAMISDRKAAMESDAGAESVERGDILTILLRFQRDGGMGGGVMLTNENISGVLFVSQPRTAYLPQFFSISNNFGEIFFFYGMFTTIFSSCQ